MDDILNEQLRLVGAAQRELAKDIDKNGFCLPNLRQLHALSGALVRAVEALARAAKVKEEMASRMSPQEILEAAIRRIESQDLATVNMVVRRLTKHRAGMVGGVTARSLVTAAEAIASLDDE